MNQMKKKGVVADFIDPIIRNHKRILLKAGVSSGKSYMAIEYLPTIGSTLIIPSRKTIKKSLIHQNERSPKEHHVDIIHIWDLQNHFDEYKNTDKFKFVVIDEIHLLTSDTFTTAAVYAAEFIKSLPSNVCLIMMSACADRTREFLEGDLGINIYYVDLSDVTCSVKPQKLLTITAKQSWDMLLKSNRDNKTLYFAATTRDAYDLESRLLSKGVSAVAITSQSENRRDKPDEREMVEINTLLCLEHNTHWPSDIAVLITTTKLREGINLHDKTIKTVITELKDVVSLIQCAGRVRHGVEQFCVVKDKTPYISYIDPDKLGNLDRLVKILNDMIYVAKRDYINDEIFSMLTGFDSVKKEYGDLIVPYEGRFIINKGLIREYRMRIHENRLYQADPEKYLLDVLGIHANPGYDKESVNQLLQSVSGIKMSCVEKNALVQQLNTAGISGTQLKVLLRDTNFTYECPRNNSWYRIIPRQSGILPIPLYPIYNQKSTLPVKHA